MSNSLHKNLCYKVMDGDQMYRHFCVEHSRANRKIFESIQYLNVSEMIRETHIVCFTEKQCVVGDLALQQSPYDKDTIWLKHISVAEKFRNNGIAGRLFEMCIEQMKLAGKKLEVSTYSEMGELYFAPMVTRAIELNTGLEIIDQLATERQNSSSTRP